VASGTFFSDKYSMDKKTKKRLDIVRKTLQKLRLQLSGTRQQDDEPGELERLESEIATLEQEAEKLKSS
jgi:cob(I)alamin adenosyltransferase